MKEDIKILKDLAYKIKEIANSPEMAIKKQKWINSNNLKTNNALVMCDPENGWNEIIPDKLKCTEDWARNYEFSFRRQIFLAEEMGDDTVVTDELDLPVIGKTTNWGIVEEITSGGPGGSYVWDAPIKDYNEDLKKLKYPTFIPDYEATQKNTDFISDIFGDILKPRYRQRYLWSLGVARVAVRLRGLEQFMLDMSDEPENLHKLMRFIADGHINFINDLTKLKLLYLNNENDYVGSGGFGWTNDLPAKDFTGHVRPKDMWVHCESQETVSVSPKMYEEFVFQYEKEITKDFGFLCYGCCEPLNTRWDIVKRFKNLRRVSVSAWADIEKMAENLKNNYVFSWKPNPSLIAMEHFDEKVITDYISDMLEKTKGCVREIILKDCHTIRRDPERVKKFCQIAQSCIEKQS